MIAGIEEYQVSRVRPDDRTTSLDRCEIGGVAIMAHNQFTIQCVLRAKK